MLALAGIGMQGKRTSAKASEPFCYIDQHSFERMLRVAHAFGRWGAAVKAAEAGGKPVTFQPPRSGALARAIHDNRSLWTALAADVAIETNPLPRPLRAQIFYLSEFTAQHSRKVLAGDASVDVLIDINTAVMRGLRGEGAAQ